MICDLSEMAEHAYLALAFSNLGLIPDCGANWLLERSIGAKRAYQVAIEGGRISADACLMLGLTNKIKDGERLLAETRQSAAQLGERAPLSLSLTKKAMRDSTTSSYCEIVSLEGEMQARCMASNDFVEGVSAIFQKRNPLFQGS